MHLNSHVYFPHFQLFNSNIGPSSAYAEALWHSYDTTGVSELLWQDPALQGWEPQTAYQWYITHAPTTGYIK